MERIIKEEGETEKEAMPRKKRLEQNWNLMFHLQIDALKFVISSR